MGNLIDITHIQEYKPISSNTNTKLKLDPFIREAQEFDLRPLLGDEFMIDFVDNIEAANTPAKYTDLFEGSTYTHNNKTYKHEGIKAVLVYYAYARYEANSQTNQTPFGVVVKSNDHSDPVSEKTISRLVNQSRSGAEAYWIRVNDFLKRNSSDYPLFNCGDTSVKSTGIRITKI